MGVMQGPEHSSILRVLRGLLRPLVRLMIVRGVTAPTFYHLLKSVYVEVAHRDFRIDDAPPTDSRVSLLTGVHRRDVRAILSDVDDSWQTTRAKTATFATVLGQWVARPDYQDTDGQPRPLPRSGLPGADFESLVQSVSRDIRPRTVLDELLRQALVRETDDGMLIVSETALAGPASDDDKIVFFAANVGDHLAAAAENLITDPAPFLERAVFYNRLTAEAVDAVEATARERAQEILEELNTQSSRFQGADRDKPDAHERYRFGVYFYREGTLDTAPDTSDDSSEDREQ
ncbi:MAG: DUF6502 family protein [Pseudomonadota bacterium]